MGVFLFLFIQEVCTYKPIIAVARAGSEPRTTNEFSALAQPAPTAISPLPEGTFLRVAASLIFSPLVILATQKAISREAHAAVISFNASNAITYAVVLTVSKPALPAYTRATPPEGAP